MYKSKRPTKCARERKNIKWGHWQISKQSSVSMLAHSPSVRISWMVRDRCKRFCQQTIRSLCIGIWPREWIARTKRSPIWAKMNDLKNWISSKRWRKWRVIWLPAPREPLPWVAGWMRSCFPPNNTRPCTVKRLYIEPHTIRTTASANFACNRIDG